MSEQMTDLEILWQIHHRAREASKQIGRPLIELPIDKIAIVEDGPRAYMEMESFIGIVEGLVNEFERTRSDQ